MSVEVLATGSPAPVGGVRLAAAAAGIRYQGRDDLVVMELAPGSTCAAVFTRNAFCAAPVIVAREHLARTAPRYLLINAGNANAGTGDDGLRAARDTCKTLAAASGCALDQVLPFSTGVIGEDLPTNAFSLAIPAMLADLDAGGWQRAARAIMTTDTRPKLASRQVLLGERPVTVTGMAKGAGMICPDMATMLAFVATDAAVAAPLLQTMLNEAVAPSFNAISVDGDTSTNDACVLVATGAAGGQLEREDDAGFSELREAVEQVCMELAHAIIADAEGGTKVVRVLVEGAASTAEARGVAYTVAHSPLVKTALFAADPNWGRILAAVGRSGVTDLAIDRVRIWLDEVPVVAGGGRHPEYREAAGQAVMDNDSFTIRVSLGRGDRTAQVLTSDLSLDYVKINAEYRS
ncbi:MAG: bifunctional glutamate N-acetyltransferase/amino-acid acetyltransferase ArgJ [Pseudomonadota bacterium]